MTLVIEGFVIVFLLAVIVMSFIALGEDDDDREIEDFSFFKK